MVVEIGFQQGVELPPTNRLVSIMLGDAALAGARTNAVVRRIRASRQQQKNRQKPMGLHIGHPLKTN
jgi:hypothetical protein